MGENRAGRFMKAKERNDVLRIHSDGPLAMKKIHFLYFNLFIWSEISTTRNLLGFFLISFCWSVEVE